MLLLGIDIGTSSIKVSVLDANTCVTVASAQYPEDIETPVTALHPGWAEQSPDMWWQHVQNAINKANASGKYRPNDIAAIGIAYQMHGLVVVDKDRTVLWTAFFFCSLTRTCASSTIVRTCAFVLSRQGEQHRKRGWRCGQPFACAGTIPRLVL